MQLYLNDNKLLNRGKQLTILKTSKITSPVKEGFKLCNIL